MSIALVRLGQGRSQVVARRGQGREDIEGSPQESRRLPVLAERHVAEPLAGKRADVVRVSGQRLLAVGNGSRVILRQVADRRPLVPPFRKVGGPLDDPGEQGESLLHLLPLDRLNLLSEEQVHLVDSRPAPDLPERGFRLGR